MDMNKYEVTLRVESADGDVIEHYDVSADITPIWQKNLLFPVLRLSTQELNLLYAWCLWRRFMISEPERCPICGSIDTPTGEGKCPHCGSEMSCN